MKAAYSSATEGWSAARLTNVLEGAVEEHQPPLANGRRIKLRYAHSGGRNPPVIIIHGNQTDALPSHYTRYLEKVYRRELELHGTPVRVKYRTGKNPYRGSRSISNDRRPVKSRKEVKYNKRHD